MTGSWVPGADTSGFPLQHLPFGSCIHRGRRFLGTRIGASVLDLGAAVAAGGFAGCSESLLDALRHDDLSLLLAAGPDGWSITRTKLGELLAETAPDAESIARCLVPVDDVELALPFPVGDFVDFYSSIDHASNIGRMFRPDAAPLLPNWRHLPVGYHGRSGTIVVTGHAGDAARRPTCSRETRSCSVRAPKLDIELEVGFVVGGSSRQGTPVPTSAMADHVFGVVLVNDWSARDIQSWEYVPLGPFLGKSFATSIAGWITPLAALEPFRVDGPRAGTGGPALSRAGRAVGPRPAALRRPAPRRFGRVPHDLRGRVRRHLLDSRPAARPPHGQRRLASAPATSSHRAPCPVRTATSADRSSS